MWKEKIIDGHWCQAKVYDEPSEFGIENGRISKLTIAKGPAWEGMSKTIYNYSRGLDFDETPNGLLQKVLLAFNN